VTDLGGLRFSIRAIALAMASLVAVALALRAAHNDYAFYLGYLVFQYVALALGWNILGGYAGFVNFGASAFFAAGAYATVALHKTTGASLPFCVAAGGAVGATLGLLMGALTLRLRGVYFAIATLSLSMVLETLVVNWSYVGGSSGAYLIRPKTFAPFTTYTEYLCLTMFAISAGAAVASAAIERSSLGAGLTAIRDDETAAAALGVPTLRLKLVAATISGAILGMTGTPLPFYNSYLNPDSAFAIGYSVNAIAMALVGGAQSWLGPVVGALLLGSLQQLALAFVSSSASLALTGLVFIVFVALAPQGLIGLLRVRERVAGQR
jgi:branched-chain amino acid transport system permease protein